MLLVKSFQGIVLSSPPPSVENILPKITCQMSFRHLVFWLTLCVANTRNATKGTLIIEPKSMFPICKATHLQPPLDKRLMVFFFEMIPSH